MPDPRIRCLIEFLRCHDLVKSLKLTYRTLQIEFITGIKEKWGIHDSRIAYNKYVLDLKKMTSRKYPKISPRFESMLNSTDYQFIIRYKDFIQCGLLQQRLAIQSLVYEIITSGDLKTKVPESALIEDIRRLEKRMNTINQDRLRNEYRISFSHPKGRMTLMHFMPWLTIGHQPISEAIRIPRRIFLAIQRILKERRDVNSERILIKLSQMGYGPKFTDPCFYRKLIRDFDLRGMIIADPEPGAGSKLLACCMEDCQYRHAPAEGLSEVAKFIGSSVKEINDNDHYDVVFLDGDFRRTPEVSHIKKWMKKADILLVFSLRKDAKLISELITPDETYGINIVNETHCLFVKN